MNASNKIKLSVFAALALGAVAVYAALVEFSEPAERDLMAEFKAMPASAPASQKQTTAARVESVEVMLVGLRQRLESQPDDVDGWLLLSKSYHHLNQWQQAQEAYEKAKSLGYDGNWKPLPRIDAFSDETASWETSQAGEATSRTAASRSPGLRLKISLAPELEAELPAHAPVFVFVRAAANSGPPLAVLRKQVHELPFEVTLDDSHAMMPGRTISSTDEVVVGARISMSGSAGRNPGDFEQLSDIVPSDYANRLDLVISRKI